MEGQWGRVRRKRRNKKSVYPQRKERGGLRQTEDTECFISSAACLLNVKYFQSKQIIRVRHDEGRLCVKIYINQ